MGPEAPESGAAAPGARRRRRLSPQKKAAFGLVVALLATAGLEGVLRLAGFPRGLVRSFSHLWSPDLRAADSPPGLFRAGFSGRVGYPPELAYDVSFNRQGLRGPELAAPGEGRARVLVLGDSITFGYHVDDAEAYPAVLQRLLRERGFAAEVVNGGCGHFTITDELRYLRGRLLTLEPDVVVLQFCSNDVTPGELGREPSLYEEILAGEDGLSWLRQTAIGEAQLQLAIALKRWRRGPPTALGGDVPEVPEELWRRYEEELQALRALLEARGTPLLLTAFPDLVSVEAPGPSPYEARLAELAARLGVPFRGALEAYRAAPDPAALYLLPLDPHPSPAGHEVLAGVVADLLAQAQVLPRSE